MKKAPFDPTQLNFTYWLKSHLNGCAFLKSFVPKTSTDNASEHLMLFNRNIGAYFSDEADFLESTLDSLEEQAAILIYQNIRSQEEVYDFFRALISAKSNRWALKPLKSKSIGDYFHTTLTFLTKGEFSTTPAGFGPFGSLPISRRAPYFALGMWAGGYKNQLKDSEEEKLKFKGKLTFPNMPNKSENEKAFEKSLADTTNSLDKMYGNKYDKNIRNLTFSFERHHEKKLLKLMGK